MVETLVVSGRVATLWCDLDMTLDLSVVTVTFKISSELFLSSRKLYKVDFFPSEMGYNGTEDTFQNRFYSSR